MKDIIDQVLASNSWPFEEAVRILKHINYKTPEKGYVLFETGYGPSGLPHIGTFTEVARTTMVREAFKKLSDIPTKLYCFSDDMDGLRKVPSNLPNQDMLKEHLGLPLTSIPDPFGEKQSFAHYMNDKLRSFLDQFEFDYEFKSATDYYQSGKFDNMLLHALEKYNEIMAIMLPTLGEERQATYSPFMPISPKTGKVLQVPTIETNLEAGTIKFYDEDGELCELPVTSGNCKLQWKPDFGMRWAALEVDYEMYGKDHMPNAKIYSSICETLGVKAPCQFFYELFLNEEGSKISKSSGNGITIDDWLKYAPVESLGLYIYHSPTKAKRLHFDVIPKNVDEYLIYNQKYFKEESEIKKFANPLYHLHSGNVPEVKFGGINFSMLLNLSSVCNPDNKSILWNFISKYNPDLTPDSSPFMDKLVGHAIRYYNDYIKIHKKYIDPTEKHKEILQNILNMLEASDNEDDSETLQSKIYAIGMEANYENLRDYFKDLYMILLGQEQGPRLGTFFKLYGLEDSIKLIKDKL